jgi:predicted enzyme related to lactoylglutathione lyase
MINAVHAVFYNKDAAATHAFFRDVLGFPWIDAGNGRLMYALPPTEMGIHETDGENRHQLYLKCDNIESTMAELSAKGVEFTQPVQDVGWGLLTALKVPGGDQLYLYEPRHASPLSDRL